MISEKCLLVPFKYSNKVAYVVEFSNKFIRLYAQGELVRKSSGGTVALSFVRTNDVGNVTVNGLSYSSSQPYVQPLVINTPYSYADLWNEEEQVWNIQTIQYGDVLYVFHKKYPIYGLKALF